MRREWENPVFEKKRRVKVMVLGFSLAIVSFLALFFLIKNAVLEKREESAAAPETQDVRRARSAPQKKTESQPEPAPAAEAPSMDAGLELPQGPSPQNKEMADKYLQAKAAFNRGEYDQALAFFQELCAQDKRFAYDVGMVYYKTNQLSEAIAYFLQALAVDPNNFQLHKALALTYYQTNELEKCGQHIQSAMALQFDPQLAQLQDKLGRESKVQKNYVDAKTSYFNVLFDGREHEEIRRTVIDLLNEAYRSVGNEMDLFPGTAVTVILYSDKDFMDVTRAPGWAGGLFDGKIRLPVRGVIGQENKLKRVIFHEYTHALVHSLTPFYPRWLSEGLAEHFSETDREKVGQKIPLNQLDIALMNADFRVVDVAYRESQDAVTYLIDRYGLYRIKDLLQYLAARESLEDAFQKAFAIPFSRFAAQWGKEE